MNTVALSSQSQDRRRWIALGIVCLAQLMNVLDTTIVNVALPSIQRELHFTQGNLTWVVNAFLITYGSFLLLAGRLGDLVGRKRVFLVGVVVFTVASALCGLAPDQGWLIVARFVQGVGAALSSSVILAIITTEFPAARERARAMSAYVFVAVAGGSLGLIAGGALTQVLSWHWIFFVNLPIGVLAFTMGRALIPEDRGAGLAGGVDWLGSLLVTLSVMAAVYAIVETTSRGWGSAFVLVPAGAAAALAAGFIALESRLQNPILPLRILRLRGLIGSSAVRAFLVSGMYSTFFLGSLYLEHVRHYAALDTGLSFLPWTVTVAILSMGITARLVARFGATRVLSAGLGSMMAGLALMELTDAHTAFFPTLLVSNFLIGLGAGTSFMPLLTVAMADVPRQDAGLGSGIVNVSQQVSGALGLAILGTIATDRTKSLAAAGHGSAAALIGGFHLAFAVAIGLLGIGIVTANIVLRPLERRAAAARAPESLRTAADAGPELEAA